MPLPLLAIAGAVSAAGGLAKSISGGIQARKYRKLIENYQRQTLTNPYENLRVSTLGAMHQQRNATQNTATALYNLRQSGASAIFGNVGKVVKQNNLVNEKVAANLDQQLARNELYKARGAMQIQGMHERREEQDLAGLGTALNVGQQAMWGGLSDIAQGGMTAMGAFGGANDNFVGKYQNRILTTKMGDTKMGSGVNTSFGADSPLSPYNKGYFPLEGGGLDTSFITSKPRGF